MIGINYGGAALFWVYVSRSAMIAAVPWLSGSSATLLRRDKSRQRQYDQPTPIKRANSITQMAIIGVTHTGEVSSDCIGHPALAHFPEIQHSPLPLQFRSVEQERPDFQHMLLYVQYSPGPPQSECKWHVTPTQLLRQTLLSLMCRRLWTCIIKHFPC